LTAWDEYFRGRGGVVFLSYCRFWERHGFVQQSLARALARVGIPVDWLDGAGWRPYQPLLAPPVAGLSVGQLFAPPGRRLSGIDRVATLLQTRAIARRLAPGKRVVWVQAGIEEALARRLPWIDVFSVFDDPYRHDPAGPLCTKARAIVCQNMLAYRRYAAVHPGKAQLLLPPVELPRPSPGATAGFPWPAGFPEKVVGYAGSFLGAGFDFTLARRFLELKSDWGVALVGRTDDAGEKAISAELERHPRFVRFPWVSPDRLAGFYLRVKVTGLFYPRTPAQDGAFAVKALESLAHGVPVAGTKVPKTEGLAGTFPFAEGAEGVARAVEEAAAMPVGTVRDLFRRLEEQMRPEAHLDAVAGALAPVMGHR